MAVFRCRALFGLCCELSKGFEGEGLAVHACGDEDEEMSLFDFFVGPEGTRALKDLVDVGRERRFCPNIPKVGSPFGFSKGDGGKSRGDGFGSEDNWRWRLKRGA